MNSTSPPLARKLTCFGFYALGETEPVRLWTTHGANGETTCQTLRALRQSYSHGPLVLVWDNVRYYHSRAVRHCAEELGIQLVYLPPYSPDLMPVERLWQWLRQQRTALHCHRDEDELRERIASFEAQLNDDPRSSTPACAPKLAWILRRRNFGFEVGAVLERTRRLRAGPSSDSGGEAPCRMLK